MTLNNYVVLMFGHCLRRWPNTPSTCSSPRDCHALHNRSLITWLPNSSFFSWQGTGHSRLDITGWKTRESSDTVRQAAKMKSRENHDKTQEAPSVASGHAQSAGAQEQSSQSVGVMLPAVNAITWMPYRSMIPHWLCDWVNVVLVITLVCNRKTNNSNWSLEKNPSYCCLSLTYRCLSLTCDNKINSGKTKNLI